MLASPPACGTPQHTHRDAHPLRPFLALVERVVGSTFALDGRSFDPIIRPAVGGEWKSIHACLSPAAVAEKVVDPDCVIGLRHRSKVRSIVIDIDNHHGSPSPYWHPTGESPQLVKLQHLALEAGIGTALYRTPSSGLHLWLLLPEPLQHSYAHRLGAHLLAAAGMEQKPGQAEVIPSDVRFTEDCFDARLAPSSQGVRLPGQAGGAVWVGHGWAEDPMICWQELEAALEASEPGPAWEALVQQAREWKRPRSFPRRAGDPSRRRSRGVVAWTGGGQSAQNLGALANRCYWPGATVEELGEAIAAAALGSPGFHRWASADTKARLSRWAKEWASCCLRRPPTRTSNHRPPSTDPGRNHRLHRKAVCAVIAAAAKVARSAGDAALQWGERKTAEAIGISRTTFRRLKSLWLSRLSAAMESIPSTGTDPCPKGGLGGNPFPLGTGGEESGLPGGGSIDSRSADPPCPSPSPPSSPSLPTSPPAVLTDRRQREREDLARWLGQA